MRQQATCTTPDTSRTSYCPMDLQVSVSQKEYIQYELVGADATFDANQTYYTGKYSWSGMNYTEKAIANETEFKNFLQMAKNCIQPITPNTISTVQQCRSVRCLHRHGIRLSLKK